MNTPVTSWNKDTGSPRLKTHLLLSGGAPWIPNWLRRGDDTTLKHRSGRAKSSIMPATELHPSIGAGYALSLDLLRLTLTATVVGRIQILRRVLRTRQYYRQSIRQTIIEQLDRHTKLTDGTPYMARKLKRLTEKHLESRREASDLREILILSLQLSMSTRLTRRQAR